MNTHWTQKDLHPGEVVAVFKTNGELIPCRLIEIHGWLRSHYMDGPFDMPEWIVEFLDRKGLHCAPEIEIVKLAAPTETEATLKAILDGTHWKLVEGKGEVLPAGKRGE